MIHFANRDVDVAAELARAVELYAGEALKIGAVGFKWTGAVKCVEADVIVHANWTSRDVIPERKNASFIAFGRLDRQDNMTLDSMFKYTH